MGKGDFSRETVSRRPRFEISRLVSNCKFLGTGSVRGEWGAGGGHLKEVLQWLGW